MREYKTNKTQDGQYEYLTIEQPSLQLVEHVTDDKRFNYYTLAVKEVKVEHKTADGQYTYYTLH